MFLIYIYRKHFTIVFYSVRSNPNAHIYTDLTLVLFRFIHLSKSFVAFNNSLHFFRLTSLTLRTKFPFTKRLNTHLLRDSERTISIIRLTSIYIDMITQMPGRLKFFGIGWQVNRPTNIVTLRVYVYRIPWKSIWHNVSLKWAFRIQMSDENVKDCIKFVCTFSFSVAIKQKQTNTQWLTIVSNFVCKMTQM